MGLRIAHYESIASEPLNWTIITSGIKSFQFTATAVENGTISSPATVSITINNVNDSPVVQLTNAPQATAGTSDILLPENSIFEFNSHL